MSSSLYTIGNNGDNDHLQMNPIMSLLFSSGSLASPARLFGRLKANKMLLTAPQLLIKHTSHTGKYKQMTAAWEGAAGGVVAGEVDGD